MSILIKFLIYILTTVIIFLPFAFSAAVQFSSNVDPAFTTGYFIGIFFGSAIIALVLNAIVWIILFLVKRFTVNKK